MLVSKVMTGSLVTISPWATIAKAAMSMSDADTGALVSEDKGTVTGIITERDLVLAIADGATREDCIIDLIALAPVTVLSGSSVVDATRMMNKHGIRHLPVVNDDGLAVGVVSVRDLLQPLVHEISDLSGDSMIEELTLLMPGLVDLLGDRQQIRADTTADGG